MHPASRTTESARGERDWDGEHRAATGREPELVALGDRVRSARAGRGMTRKALSRVAGVSERHLANLELGEGNVSFLVLLQIAEALQTPMAELVGDFTTGSPSWLKIRAMLEGKDEAALDRVLQLISEELNVGVRTGGTGSRIALIGLRGAGKSTLGRMLADDLDFPFVELSREIERLAGCSVGEIQALYGPSAYRRHERRALEECIQIRPEAVIATPGGIVSDPVTLNLLMAHCTTVWLRARPEEHMQRVIDQGDMRPMAGNEEAMQDLRDILDSRTPHYSRARFQVDTSDVPVREAFSRLLRTVGRTLQ